MKKKNLIGFIKRALPAHAGIKSAASVIAMASVVSLAQADTLLYPYFDTRAGHLTFTTMVNKSPAKDVHWIYRYDDPSTAGNDCLHLAGFGTTEANDVMTFDVSKTLGSDPIPAADTNSTGFLIGPGFHGYLMVYTYTGTYPGSASAEHSLSGEATVVNVATGEIYKYRASNDTKSSGEANLDDLAYGANGSAVSQMPTLIWHAPSIVDLKINVTVVDFQMNKDGVIPAATIGLADTGGSINNFYDVNSNLLGGAAAFTVTCFGDYTLSDFLPGAALSQAAAGGWAHVQIRDLDPETDGNQAPFSKHRGILVNKMETTTAITGALQSVYTSANRTDF